MTSVQAPHVLIVGAGTVSQSMRSTGKEMKLTVYAYQTGLLIAQGLKKYGIAFTVFEADSQDNYLNHQRDWSMALLWGADYIKNTLPEHLLARFDEIKTDRFYVPEVGHEQTMPFHNGKTGELVVRIPGGLATRVSRVKLRKLFAEDLQIEFDKRVANVEENGEQVTLTFTDASTATGTTVVFCDGVKSSAGRGLLLGEEQAKLAVCDCSIVNITHRYPAEQARFIRGSLNPVFKFASHPEDETLFLLTNLEKPEDWNFQFIFTTWGATIAEAAEERMRTFKEQASKYAEPWRSAVQWLPDDKSIPRDRIKYWKSPTPWPIMSGKVTLAGDAAHPMVPFRAQGLNNAMRDSYGYVEALRKITDGTSSLDAAIKEYSDEVFARGAKEIAMSNGAGPLMHNWELLMQSPLMKWSYERPPATQESASQASAPSQVPAAPKEEVSSPVMASEKPIDGEAEAQEMSVAEPAAPEPVTPAKETTSTVADAQNPATPEMEPDTGSPATSNVQSPELAPVPFTIPLSTDKTVPHTNGVHHNGVHVNGERPSWESLYAENQKLRKLNEDLISKLLDVSRVLGTGLSLEKAQAMIAGGTSIDN